MISIEQFQSLIEQPESSILDFKKELYDFDHDSDLRKTAEFVKDVMCFCNTIRNETSYIIFGIEETNDHSKTLHGLSRAIDDAIFQDKVKDKIYPRPQFSYYTVDYNQMRFGVMEFPVTKYMTPLSCTIKMKGIEPGKIYYRNGTANTEALGLEIIKINDWLRSLPEVSHGTNRNQRIGQLLKDLTSDMPLSTIIADLYAFSTEYGVEVLKRFCMIELSGTESSDAVDSELLEYRGLHVLISSLSISFNPYFNGPSSVIKEELKKTDGVREYKVVFSYSLGKIEGMQRGFKDSDKSILVINNSSKQFFGERVKTDFTVYVYVFPEQITNLLANIRQKAIDLLMEY